MPTSANWCIGNKTLINKLQKTCNKFIRMACNLRHYRDVTDVRKTHQLLTINQLLTKEIAVFMFKQNSGKNPDVFRNVFVKSISQYNTRNRFKLIPKPCSSSLCQQSISYQGPAIWSKLPIFFKNEKNVCCHIQRKVAKLLVHKLHWYLNRLLVRFFCLQIMYAVRSKETSSSSCRGDSSEGFQIQQPIINNFL